jgi:hypothetical protein
MVGTMNNCNMKYALMVVLIACSTAWTQERRARLWVLAVPEPAVLMVDVNLSSLTPLPKPTVPSEMRVSVLDADGAEVIGSVVRKIRPADGRIVIKKDVSALPPGTYQVVTTLFDQDGGQIGRPYPHELDWPGQPEEFKGIRILNNLVWELLRVEHKRVDGTERFIFKSPKRRWVYVAATTREAAGTMRISLNEHKDIITFAKDEKATKESMRFLPAGEHELIVSSDGACRLESLVIRSIPEILLHEFMGGPSGDLEMSLEAFYAKHVMPNVNTFVGAPGYMAEDHDYLQIFKKWRQGGGRLLLACPARGTPDIGDSSFTVEQAYEFMASTKGLTNPFADGIIIDEFIGHNDPSYSNYGQAIRQLRESPTFKNKLIYTYIGTLYGIEPGKDLVSAIVDSGGTLAWERYLSTASEHLLPNPSGSAARNFLREEYGLVDSARFYRDRCPGSIEHLAVCFGFFSKPGGHLLNATPWVNYNVYLDMQFNVVANNPAFWGTYGLMGYHTSYSDEETLRWICRLFRHYGMEGNTRPATDDPYSSPHLVNGDFEDGTQGWQIAPAVEDSIRTGSQEGLGFLQTRYGRKSGGDTGLVMARSASGPNAITREIMDLQPGKLYTFRMMTSDFKDMSNKENHAVSVRLDNVTLIPERTITQLFPNPTWGGHPPYDGNTHQAWLAYHWYLFRANETTAKLTLSDWADDEKPGGTIGQELIFNFIQVHPYYAPEGDKP